MRKLFSWILGTLAALAAGAVVVFSISRIRRQAELNVDRALPGAIKKDLEDDYEHYRLLVAEEEERLSAMKAEEVRDAFRKAFGL